MSPIRKFIRGMRKKYEPINRLASFAARGREKETSLIKKYYPLWLGMAGTVLLLAVMALAIQSTIDRVAPQTDVIEDFVADLVSLPPRHPLTGERLDEVHDKLPQVFGVMVENSADAWPLVGLDQAFLVIEAPVEGHIPRFIVFFSEESEVEKVGPVRSARPYYLDWNDELQGVYAHVGGSPEALDLINYEYDTIDLNQFYQSEYFYRQNYGGRYAPHNVYTTSDELIESLDELQLDDPTYKSWQFKDDNPIEDNQQSLKINWTSGSTYDVEWRYNQEDNAYLRYQGRSVMKMEDGSTILAKNVVVMATDIRVIDSVGRKRLTTVGEGDALIAQDGEVFLGRWKKDERTDRLRFYTHDGYEISMNAGKTWIEVVDDLDQVDAYDAK